MIPARGLLLVRPVDVTETLAGGRVILVADTRERMAANQYEVVAVGAFAVCLPERSRAERKCTRPHVIEACGGCEDVVECGAGMHWCADRRRVHAHSIRVGDWILTAPRVSIAGPDPESSACFVHQDSVWGIFHDGAGNV